MHVEQQLIIKTFLRASESSELGVLCSYLFTFVPPPHSLSHAVTRPKWLLMGGMLPPHRWPAPWQGSPTSGFIYLWPHWLRGLLYPVPTGKSELSCLGILSLWAKGKFVPLLILPFNKQVRTSRHISAAKGYSSLRAFQAKYPKIQLQFLI